MIIDSATITPGSVIETDICIIGSGPAGLSLARELKNSPYKVAILESGGFKPRRALKKLNEGTTVGDPYPNPRWGRHRQFGGTANRWLVEIGGHKQGARYAPLDAIDFEKRDWIPFSGWEISRADLDPFYERAQVHCGLGRYAYDASDWETESQKALLFKDGRLITTVFQFGAKDVWTSHYNDVTQAANVTAIVNGTALEIETDEGGTNITGVRAANPDHQQFFVRAKQVILATGCIENARLLLLSRSKHANGIGNQYDVVGRYFMDHPQSYLNVFTPGDRGIFNRTDLYDLRPMDGGYAVMGELVFSEETLRKEQLQSMCFVMFPRRDGFMSKAFQSFFDISLTVIHRQRPSGLLRHAVTMLKGTPDLMKIAGYALQGKAVYPYISRGGWSKMKDKAQLFNQFELFSLLEQAPDPSNRITLGDHLDSYGQPQVKIFWRFTERDQESVRRAREVMTQEFANSGLGTVAFSQDSYTSPSSVHPIGSTRMNNDPHYGVVDQNCKVHGTNNLYIAGSSVFPTGGYVNPTLTVVALACRLADHLKQQAGSIPTIAEAAPAITLS